MGKKNYAISLAKIYVDIPTKYNSQARERKEKKEKIIFISKTCTYMVQGVVFSLLCILVGAVSFYDSRDMRAAHFIGVVAPFLSLALFSARCLLLSLSLFFSFPFLFRRS